MLASVVATDDRRACSAWVCDGEGVIKAVTNTDTIVCGGGCCVRRGKDHGVKVYPQLANSRVALTDCVLAWVSIRTGGEG